MPGLDDILSVILGGGRGARLYPLTKVRSKPAVPVAGKYRLIDIPISNCINSGIFRIAVLTQFNSVSLHRHITRTYDFDAFHSGWVQVWASQQTVATNDWYQGTADAVRKQLFEIRSARADYVLVLSGDHLYRMNYAEMANYHWGSSAEITVAVQPVAKDATGRFGILKRDSNGRIISFSEKPNDPAILKGLVSRSDPDYPYLASMGIYLFNTELLCDLLESKPFDDFGGHVIPYAIKSHKVQGYEFNGYWEDIGTMRSFYEANLRLTEPDPPFNFIDPNYPIYTHSRFLPGSTMQDCHLENVLLCEGCCLQNAEVQHSVIGLRSQIHAGVRIRNSIIMGADYYEDINEFARLKDGIELGIGNGAEIEGAIIDKNARVGRGVIIKPFPRGTEMDMESWVVRDGIVVIPKGATLLPGTVIAPGQESS
jgi:glucose-1-phosphate adenylyltransferase